jgi:hypothetical protein
VTYFNILSILCQGCRKPQNNQSRQPVAVPEWNMHPPEYERGMLTALSAVRNIPAEQNNQSIKKILKR